jgi:hypothetical protein
MFNNPDDPLAEGPLGSGVDLPGWDPKKVAAEIGNYEGLPLFVDLIMKESRARKINALNLYGEMYICEEHSVKFHGRLCWVIMIGPATHELN